VAQDSSRPEFWDTRFRGGVTPWDAGGVPPLFSAFLNGKSALKVLVPGCGTGYEIRELAQRGHDVLGIDFSEAAVEAAQAFLGPLGGRVRKADFFALSGRFDLVYERAFLCALPRALWSRWAARMAELVKPGGELAGFFFFDQNEKGPPFGIAPHALEALLGGAFTLEVDRAVDPSQSLPVFAGKERWQVRRRKL
jgi:SAM-dependent methyltransferase